MTLTGTEMIDGICNEIGRLISGTTTSDGDAGGTTFLDSVLGDYPDNAPLLLNTYALLGSGAYSGQERPISAFVSATGQVTVRRAYGGQIVTGVTYKLRPWSTIKMLGKINQAIKRTEYLFKTIRDESLTTVAATYYYTVPATIIGEPLEIYTEETGTPTKPYSRLMDWEYDETNKQIQFKYSLPSDRKLRLVGKGYLSTLATAASSTETEEPNVSHLYALALAYLYQENMAQVAYAERSEWERDIAFWLNEAETRGKQIELNLPPPTQKRAGWSY